MNKEDFINSIRQRIGYIATAIGVLAYIISGFVSISPKTNDIWSILIDSILLFFLGISITNTLNIQALIDGESSTKVIDAKKELNDSYNNIKNNTQYIDAYVLYKNKKAEQEVRASILREHNLDYTIHFDNNGELIYNSLFIINDNDSDFVKKDKEQKNKILKKLSKGVKVSKISRGDVLCQNIVDNRDPLKRVAVGESMYLAGSNGKTIISKIFTTLICGCYGASFIGLNAGDIIYKVMWATIILILGLVEYIKTYRYKTTDYVARLKQSTEWLDEFYNLYQTQEIQDIFNNYIKSSYYNNNFINNNSSINNNYNNINTSADTSTPLMHNYNNNVDDVVDDVNKANTID